MAVMGLTESEAAARRNAGQGNNIALSTSRSYADIIRYNVFNFMNVILFSIGVGMILLGRVGDAVTSVGLIFVNVIIGVVQEIRAKRQLDRIALLTRPRATVLRDGTEREIDPSELVVGDVIVVKPGDQIVVDGPLLEGELEADEALLTGEADLVKKKPGDALLSGSYCISGSGLMQAEKVGAESYANQLTATARKFQVAFTPLQKEVNFLLRVLMLMASFFGILFLISFFLASVPVVRQVQAAAIIAGLVPNGLFFMVILAYAMGALRIVRQGALVQQTNAVEALSNVTVLCTDKTGTLTANRIHYDGLHAVCDDTAEVEAALADFASSVTVTNKTSEAIRAALGGNRRRLADEVPFSSALKWSAVAFDDEQRRGVYVLGAPEMLAAHLSLDEAAQAQWHAWADDGFRVLIFAHNPATIALHNDAGEPSLPPLTPLAVLRFSDELRPHLKETLEAFIQNGIDLKIISGDNPATVAALARQAGFTGDLTHLSGVEIAEMEDAQLAERVKDTVVFGRITPDQKERIVEILRQQGNYVAMIGDGVNDVLSLKKADMGIAMESGSSATRAVADMILIGDSFEALPPAFTEGQRIVNGMADIMRLFLTRTFATALLILSTAVIGVGFPYLPKHIALMLFLSVGVPTIALAVWARPGKLPRRSLLRQIAHFVVPAAMTIALFGLLIYMLGFIGGLGHWIDVELTEEDIRSFSEYVGIGYTIFEAEEVIVELAHMTAQSALTVFTTLAGLLLVIFVEPPTEFFVGGDEFSGDWRPTILAGVMLVVFMVVLAVDPLRRFFELVALPLWAYLAIGGLTLVWMLLLRAAWRGRWLQRFLRYDF